MGKLDGRHKIAPSVGPNKTWEGSPAVYARRRHWYGAVEDDAVHALGRRCSFIDRYAAGFAGSLVMSTIKRDHGLKDFGTVIEGHGGIRDRIDSLIFAAPIFFHIVWFFYATN